MANPAQVLTAVIFAATTIVAVIAQNNSKLPDTAIPSGTGGAPVAEAPTSPSADAPVTKPKPPGIVLRLQDFALKAAKSAEESDDADAIAASRCEKLGVAASDCTDYEAILKRLKEAWTAYTCPKQMWKNREETVVFILDATKTNAVSEQTARKEMSTLLGAAPADVVPKLTKIARQMSASLAGASFKIEPSGPQMMTVTEAAPVRWEWRVTPNDKGEKTLTLTLAVAVGKDEENTHPVQIKTLVEHINVDVSTWDQALSIIPGANSLVGGVAGIVAVIMGVFAWLRRKAWLPLVSKRPKQP